MKAGYEALWAKARVLPQREAELKALADKLARYRVRYEIVEHATGVPWWFTAIIHERESDCDFTTHLANGDPLDHKTVHVPAGRGPFATWELGAIDALRYMGLDKIEDWSIPHALYQFERYNGWGYIGRTNSPYVWSWTDLYDTGKFQEVWNGSRYVSVFKPSLKDPQPGAAAMLKSLITLIPSLIGGVVASVTTAAVPSSTSTTGATVPAPSAGVTLSASQNLATHVIAAIGAVIAASGFGAAHSLYDFFTSSTFFGGTLVSLLAAQISHLSVIGMNDNTIAIIDRVVKDVTPQQQSLLQQAAALDPNTHTQA